MSDSITLNTLNTLTRASLIERLVSKFRTRNAILDTFISLVLVESGLVQVIGRWIATNAAHLFGRYVAFIARLLRTRQNTVTKTCRLQSITPELEINTIFPKIQWFLRYHTKLNTATDVNIQWTKDANSPVQTTDCRSTIHWNGIKIDFTESHEIITIYADRTYQRKMHKIDLVAHNVPANCNVFVDLAVAADAEYKTAMKSMVWQQKVYMNNTSGSWEQMSSLPARRTDTIILKNGQMENLCRDFNDFLKSEEWYINRGILYARGYLFRGSPGTGKSSTVRALAASANRDVHYLILSNVTSDDQLIALMKHISAKDTIIVIEDVDCASSITHDRAAESADSVNSANSADSVNSAAKPSKSPSKSLTLSGLLQMLDSSMLNMHGRIVIMTTNHADVLDPALVRSGRIDMRVDFTTCDAQQTEALYRDFFAKPAPSPMTADVTHLSPADVSGLFVRHKNSPTVAWDVLLAGYTVE